MTGTAASRVRGGPVPPVHPYDSLTHVELTHVEKRIENWIRFGRAAHERILDRRRRIVSYRPGSVFAFVRWAANEFGTVISRIDIVRAVEPGEAHQTLPFVLPGGEILLKIEGWPKVEDVLRFERELLDHLRRHTTVLDRLRETNVLDDDTVAELDKATDAFILEFQGGTGHGIGAPGHEEHSAADVDDVNQEKIVKGRRA